MNKVYSIINDMVIEGLNREGFAWFKPWKSGGENRPFNRAKRNFYKGFNVFMLNAVMRHNNYSTNQWLSYKQAKDLGGQVRKGEKSTEVFLWNIGYFDNKTQKFVAQKLIKTINTLETMEDGKLRYKKTFSLRFFKVFNVDQCDGIEPIDTGDAETNDNQRIDSADDVALNYLERESIPLEFFDDSAYYAPSRDLINMPKLETFVDSDSYYKVLFHEMVHSTGHEKRLKREGVCGGKVNFGSDSYAKEELVAEIGCMYLVGLLGLDPKDNMENSQAYIKGWCKNLKEKPDQCVFAMGQASKAVDYIIG